MHVRGLLSMLLATLLLKGAMPVQATELRLAWEFPRRHQLAPRAFVLAIATASPSATPTTVTIPPAPPAACVTVPDRGPDTFCTRLPCPAPGVYRFVVQAQWPDGRMSEPSNAVLCAIRAGDPTCACTPLEQGPGLVTGGGEPRPLGPVPPGVTAPPPTPPGPVPTPPGNRPGAPVVVPTAPPAPPRVLV